MRKDQAQNSANHLVWVEWPSKFDSPKGRDGRPRPSHLSAGWRCEWKELDSLKSKRLAIRFLRILSGRKASHGAARPPRPTISGNPACSTLRRFRGQTLSSEPMVRGFSGRMGNSWAISWAIHRHASLEFAVRPVGGMAQGRDMSRITRRPRYRRGTMHSRPRQPNSRKPQ